MGLIKNLGKMARQSLVSDDTVHAVISPIVQKTTEAVEKTVDNNAKVPNVLGMQAKEAKDVLESLGLKVSILQQRTPNKKYAQYAPGEVVEMEYDTPSLILKGVHKGSLVKIYTADESVLTKSRSWRYKLLS